MTLLDALAKQLDEEAKGNATPPETVNSQELYERLLDKKMKEMETMFTNKMNTLIEQMQSKKVETVDNKSTEEGETNDNTTDVSVGE